MNALVPDPTFELPALNGANPLAFLTSLGALVTLRQAGHTDVRLGWKRTTCWTPILSGLNLKSAPHITKTIADQLLGKHVTNEAEAERESSQCIFDSARKALKDKLADIKKRKIRGAERAAAYEMEVAPLQKDAQIKRECWLTALKDAVPSEELALGKHIDCTADEFREHATTFLAAADWKNRQSADFLAAFGSDALEKSGRLRSTPFCFIAGSGHQYFLDTVRLLMERASSERVFQALFRPWQYQDETLSMRWDPIEDRRYALMDRDPTSANNKPQTVWMANLLAYRSLILFPCAATTRGLGTTAWMQTKTDMAFTWPMWEKPLRPELIQSLLQLESLHENEIDHGHLRALGIAAVFRSRRIQIGNPPLYKINFTPARGV